MNEHDKFIWEAYKGKSKPFEDDFDPETYTEALSAEEEEDCPSKPVIDPDAYITEQKRVRDIVTEQYETDKKHKEWLALQVEEPDSGGAWVYVPPPPPPKFEATWTTSLTSTSFYTPGNPYKVTGATLANQIKLPLLSTGTYDFTIDWGDGSEDTITAWDQAEVTHTYATAGEYTTTIIGTLKEWSFIGSGDILKITNISDCL